MEQDKQIEDDYSKLNVFGENLELNTIIPNNIKDYDEKESFHLSELTDENHKILENRMFDAIEVENKLYNKNMLRVNQKSKEKDETIREKESRIPFYKHDKLKSKNSRNKDYISSLKNKNFESRIEPGKKNISPERIKLNYGPLPETLQQSEINQYGGALPEHVDLTDEQEKGTLHNWINPLTRLPKWQIVSEAKQTNRAIFLLKIITKYGYKKLMYFPQVRDLTANSPRLYHNYITTLEGNYLSATRTSLNNPPEKAWLRSNFAYPPFNNHYYEPCYGSHPFHGPVGQPLHDPVRDSQFMFQGLLPGGVVFESCHNPQIWSKLREGMEIVIHNLRNAGARHLNEKTATIVKTPTPGQDRFRLYVPNSPSQADDGNWLIKPANMKLIRPTFGLLIDTTTNSYEYNKNLRDSMKLHSDQPGVVNAGDILFFEMCSKREVERYTSYEFSHDTHENITLGVHRKFIRMKDTPLNLSESALPICYTRHHDGPLTSFAQKLNNVNQLPVISYRQYKLDDTKRAVNQILNEEPIAIRNRLKLGLEGLREMRQEMIQIKRGRDNQKTKLQRWIAQTMALPDSNNQKQRFMTKINQWCGRDGTFLETEIVGRKKGSNDRHCFGGQKDRQTQYCMKSIWSNGPPGTNPGRNYENNCKRNNYEKLRDQVLWFTNTLSYIVSRSPRTLPLADVSGATFIKDNMGDTYFEDRYFRKLITETQETNPVHGIFDEQAYINQFWRNSGIDDNLLPHEMGCVKMSKYARIPASAPEQLGIPLVTPGSTLYREEKFYKTFYRGSRGAWHIGAYGIVDQTPAGSDHRHLCFKQFVSFSAGLKTGLEFSGGNQGGPGCYVYCIKIAPDVPCIPYSNVPGQSKYSSSCYHESEVLLPPGCVMIIPPRGAVRYKNRTFIRAYVYYPNISYLRTNNNNYLNTRSPTYNNINRATKELLPDVTGYGHLCKTKLRVPFTLLNDPTLQGISEHSDIRNSLQGEKQQGNMVIRTYPQIRQQDGHEFVHQLYDFWENDQIGGATSFLKNNNLKNLLEPGTSVKPGRFALQK